MKRSIEEAEAANSLNPHEIVETVIQNQGAFCLACARDNAWRVPELGGDCQSIVRFAEKVVKMVGVPGTFEHRRIYAIESAPTVAIDVNSFHGGLCQDVRTHASEPWTLILTDAGNGLNCYEAVARLTACGSTRLYPGGVPGVVLDNKDDLLNVFRALSWIENGTVQEDAIEYPDIPPNSTIPTCP